MKNALLALRARLAFTSGHGGDMLVNRISLCATSEGV